MRQGLRDVCRLENLWAGVTDTTSSPSPVPIASGADVAEIRGRYPRHGIGAHMPDHSRMAQHGNLHPA